MNLLLLVFVLIRSIPLLLSVAWFWVPFNSSDASTSHMSGGSGMTPILWWQGDEDETAETWKSFIQFSPSVLMLLELTIPLLPSELSHDEVNRLGGIGGYRSNASSKSTMQCFVTDVLGGCSLGFASISGWKNQFIMTPFNFSVNSCWFSKEITRIRRGLCSEEPPAIEEDASCFVAYGNFQESYRREFVPLQDPCGGSRTMVSINSLFFFVRVTEDFCSMLFIAIGESAASAAREVVGFNSCVDRATATAWKCVIEWVDKIARESCLLHAHLSPTWISS